MAPKKKGPRIVGSVKPGAESNEKRFYISGVVLEDNCPTCGKKATRDFTDEYLSYPVFGEPIAVALSCEEEGHPYVEWEVDIILNFSVELAK